MVLKYGKRLPFLCTHHFDPITHIRKLLSRSGPQRLSICSKSVTVSFAAKFQQKDENILFHYGPSPENLSFAIKNPSDPSVATCVPISLTI